MNIPVTYIPSYRRYVDGLHIDHIWRIDDHGRLRAVAKYTRILVDITDIPF